MNPPAESLTQLPFAPAMRVGDIVAARPLAARFFERLGIDYCCGGKQTLAEACARRQLDPATIALTLDLALQAFGTAPVVDAAAMTLTALADHIEQTHHRYLKAELPLLVEQAERVTAKHGAHDPTLATVSAIVRELAVEMFLHMEKEERILFPIVRALEATGEGAGHCGSIANPIRVMEAEHDSAGGALARLRELTSGFSPPADACNTHRAFLASLARLETDLHEHVHKENNILFPRAIALEQGAVAVATADPES
jgi:regulator of cell morphogenesis and NO signaling